MKNLLLCLFLTLATALQADTFTTLKVVVTNNPADGNTLVLNGATKTFKATVTDIGTQVAIGAATLDTANNLAAHILANPLANLSIIQSAGTNLVFATKINTAVTASRTGTWGTLTLTTNTVTQFLLNLPLSGEPASRRGLAANHLVDGLRDYATISLAATSVFAGQLVGTGTAQTIGGAKTFTGATTLSNASQVIAGGGYATNLQLKKVVVPYLASSAPQGLYFRNNAGGDASAILSDVDGFPVLYNVYLGAPGSALDINPAPGHLLNKNLGDYLYPKLAAFPNTFLGTNKFAQITNSVFSKGVIEGSTLTNVNINAASAFLTNPIFSGVIVVTNTINGSILRFYNGAAGVNEKQWDVSTLGQEFRAYVYADDLSSAYKWLAAKRDGASVTNVTFQSAGTVGIYAGDKITISGLRVNSPAPLVLGSDMDAPASMSAGAILNNATPPSADPSAGVAVFAASGDPQYRGSTATGGSGGNRHLHNAAAEVVGTGADSAFGGTTYARVDFSGVDPEITLPTDGTYLVQATVSLVNGAIANDVFSFKLYNSTDSADVVNSEQTKSNLAASTQDQVILRNVVTVAGSKLIQLYGKNATAARGSVKAVQTTLSYVRLH